MTLFRGLWENVWKRLFKETPFMLKNTDLLCGRMQHLYAFLLKKVKLEVSPDPVPLGISGEACEKKNVICAHH